MLNNDRAILDHQYLFIFPHRAKTDLSVPPASVGQSWPLQTEGLVARPFPGYLAALDWQPALYFLGHDCLGDSLQVATQKPSAAHGRLLCGFLNLVHLDSLLVFVNVAIHVKIRISEFSKEVRSVYTGSQDSDFRLLSSGDSFIQRRPYVSGWHPEALLLPLPLGGQSHYQICVHLQQASPALELLYRVLQSDNSWLWGPVQNPQPLLTRCPQ